MMQIVGEKKYPDAWFFFFLNVYALFQNQLFMWHKWGSSWSTEHQKAYSLFLSTEK